MAYTDADVARKGHMDRLLANSAVTAIVASRIYADVVPQGITLPALAVSTLGFVQGPRPIVRGGVNTQIWSTGTVTVTVVTAAGYSPTLNSAVQTAIDNMAGVAVGSVGTIYSSRYNDASDTSQNVGDVLWKLHRINFAVLAKAT